MAIDIDQVHRTKGQSVANSRKRCKQCKKYFLAAAMVKTPVGTFCTFEHAFEFANDKQEKEKQKSKEWKDDFHKRIRQNKPAEVVMTRADWYNKLQDLVNQYVNHVRDKGRPCCTCSTEKADIKYDAGHCFTRGSRSELRFELTNIHRQCSQDCNVYNSGRQSEHKQFIIDKYGADHLAKLEDRTQWPSLKERFQAIDDIKLEIDRYRKLIRSAGLKAVR